MGGAHACATTPLRDLGSTLASPGWKCAASRACERAHMRLLSPTGVSVRLRPSCACLSADVGALKLEELWKEPPGEPEGGGGTFQTSVFLSRPHF